jgi:hypothetical protein
MRSLMDEQAVFSIVRLPALVALKRLLARVNKTVTSQRLLAFEHFEAFVAFVSFAFVHLLVTRQLGLFAKHFRADVAAVGLLLGVRPLVFGKSVRVAKCFRTDITLELITGFEMDSLVAGQRGFFAEGFQAYMTLERLKGKSK